MWGGDGLELDRGYRSNHDGTRWLLDALRLAVGGYKPRVVFTSSIAVFGAPFPDAIGDEFFHTPLLSYGTQKAIGARLLADYSRRGFMDGIGIRLPTICIRPGLPNKAASGFFSNILREPLAGKEAVLPVSEDVRHWHASPRSAVGFLIHASTMDSAAAGARRDLTMPGLSATLAEHSAPLNRVAGDRAAPRVPSEPAPSIIALAASWTTSFLVFWRWASERSKCWSFRSTLIREGSRRRIESTSSSSPVWSPWSTTTGLASLTLGYVTQAPGRIREVPNGGGNPHPPF